MHLLLDLDGTLVDTRPGILRAMSAAIHNECPGTDPASVDFPIGPPVREAFQSALRNASPGQLDRLVLSFRQAYDRDGWRESTLYPGVAGTLADLIRLGHTCYIVTNKPALPTALIVQRVGLSRFLSETVSLDPLRAPRISKAHLIRHLLSKYSIHPGEALLVGDTIADWQAAEASGVWFAGVAYGYGGLDLASTQFAVISDFTELPSLIPRFAPPVPDQVPDDDCPRPFS